MACLHTMLYGCEDGQNDTFGDKMSNGSVSLHRHFEIAILFSSCLFLLLGIVGNVLVVYVVVRKKDMRSVYNIFIANLAIRDIVFLAVFALVKIINHGSSVFSEHEFDEVLMSSFSVYVLMVTVLVTSGLLVALAQDRYQSIGHPLQSRSKKSLNSAVLVTVSIWTVSLVICVVHPALHTPEYELSWLIVVVVTVFVAYIIPLVAVFICHIFIFLAVRRRKQESGDSNHLARWEFKRKMRVLRMVACIILLFSISWGFWWSINIHVAYKRHLEHTFLRIEEISLDIADVVVLANSALNPFIYGLTNSYFNRHFKKILCGFCAPRSLQNTTISPEEAEAASTRRNGNSAVLSDRKMLRMSVIELETSV